MHIPQLTIFLSPFTLINLATLLCREIWTVYWVTRVILNQITVTILFNDCTVHQRYAPGELCWLQINKLNFAEMSQALADLWFYSIWTVYWATRVLLIELSKLVGVDVAELSQALSWSVCRVILSYPNCLLGDWSITKLCNGCCYRLLVIFMQADFTLSVLSELYVIVKALPQVCMKIQHEGSVEWLIQIIYHKTPPSAVFHTHRQRQCFKWYIAFDHNQLMHVVVM